MSLSARGTNLAPNSGNPDSAARRHSTSTNFGNDDGDPIRVLAAKGITQANKGDLQAIVSVLKSFGNFGKTANGRCSIKAEEAKQIQAITALLEEIANHGPRDSGLNGAMFEKLDSMKDEICKTIIGSLSGNGPRTSYAAITANGSGPSNRAANNPKKQDLEHEIFISTKSVPRDSYLFTDHPSLIIEKVNLVIEDFYNMQSDNRNICGAMKSLQRLPNGNIVFTAKDADTAMILCHDSKGE